MIDELSQIAVLRARQMTIAGTPEEVAVALIPYLGLGFDMFLIMERLPLDYETLRLFMQDVAPRLRDAAHDVPDGQEPS
jgi:alkanesulfonate monooxygenase SsuD/methylene tetrahydromethanopterin reductase-like flavin-dependent oxidoreductase (luciferase family)